MSLSLSLTAVVLTVREVPGEVCGCSTQAIHSGQSMADARSRRHTIGGCGDAAEGGRGRGHSVGSAADCCVRVAVRVRPLSAREKVDRCNECVAVLDSERQVAMGKGSAFTYDYVFGTQSTQGEIYEQVRCAVNAHAPAPRFCRALSLTPGRTVRSMVAECAPDGGHLL